MPVDTRVASGDTAILKCIPPRGNPKPRIHWLKNGQPLSSTEPRWHVTEVGSLVIEAVQKSDEANYVCRAENMVGARDSETVRLNVHGELIDTICVTNAEKFMLCRKIIAENLRN